MMTRQRARLLIVGLALVGWAGVIAVSSASTGAREVRKARSTFVAWQFYCASAGRTLRYVFWPRGHSGPGTPSTFPDRTYRDDNPYSDEAPPDPTLAHLNVYRRAGFADRDWLLFVSATPDGSRGPLDGGYASAAWHKLRGPCFGPVPGDTRFDGSLPKNAVSSRKATALRCTFTSRWGYVGTLTGARRTATVYQRSGSNQRGRDGLLTVVLDEKHPKLTWNPEFCRRTRLPR